MLIYMLPGWSEPVISWCRKGMSMEGQVLAELSSNLPWNFQ